MKDDIFKPTTVDENLHEVSNDNSVKEVNFATSKMKLSRQHFHGTAFINIFALLMRRCIIRLISLHERWHSSISGVQFFSNADCDTDQYHVPANVKERLVVGKRATKKMLYAKI
jgi:hypothetical protein